MRCGFPIGLPLGRGRPGSRGHGAETCVGRDALRLHPSPAQEAEIGKMNAEKQALAAARIGNGSHGGTAPGQETGSVAENHAAGAEPETEQEG